AMMGHAQELEVSITAPGATTPRKYTTSLNVGGTYSVVVDAQSISTRMIQEKGEEYAGTQAALAAVTDTTTSISTQSLIADGLDLIARGFAHQADKYLQLAARDLDLHASRLPSVVLAGYSLNSTYLFGIPYQVSSNKVELDQLSDDFVASSLDGQLDSEVR